MMRMREIWKVVDGLKAVMLLVMVQSSYAVLNVLYKLAVSDGMNLRVLIAYRFIFATAFMAPLSLFFERKKMPNITWTILFQSLLCGLFGGLVAQTLFLETLALTSLTFTSAMNNLTPLVTFIMSVCFRVERLNWREAGGKAKSIGTLIGIGGAMVLTFLKGPQIHTPSFHVSFLHPHQSHVASPHSSSAGSTLLGAICSMGGSISFALWLIVQSKMSERFPCYYSSTALMNVMASLFSVAFAFCFERDFTHWRLGWNIRLLTVAYAGLVPAGAAVVAIAWCVHTRGPVFVSAFNPLLLLLLAFVGSFFMNEKLHLASIIGGVLIVCGLYAVLWGKGKEMKNNKMNNIVLVSSSHTHTHHHVSPTIKILVKSPANDHKSAINLNHSNINTSNHVVIRNQQDHSSQNIASEAVHA